MEKNILIIMTPFNSHLIPTYKLASTFKAKGYNVVYVSSLKFRKEIESKGFVFQNSALVDQDGVFMKTGKLIAHLISNFKPEICLIEVAFWNWALFLMGMQQKFMMIQTWPCCDKGTFIRPEGYRIVEKRNLLSYIRNEIAWIKQNRRNRREFRSPELGNYYRGVVMESGLDPTGTYISKKNRIGYFRVCDAIELILSPVEFDFPRKIKPTTKFIGPFMDVDRIEEGFRWETLQESTNAIVFCSMGSMTALFKRRNDFFERVIAAFSMRPNVSLIISTGQGNKVFIERNFPQNIHVCEYAPQIEILKRADLFITHGGAGSVKESIYFGVPMLVYPWQSRSDMFGNADRVVYHNLGLMGSVENDTPEDIIKRVSSILGNHKISENIKKMKTRVQEYEHRENDMVDFILNY